MKKILSVFAAVLIFSRRNNNMLWSLIITVLVGALCGWLASILMKTSGSLLWYIVLGIIGGLVGNIVFGLFGIGANNIIGRVLVGVAGTCIVIAVYRMITGKK